MDHILHNKMNLNEGINKTILKFTNAVLMIIYAYPLINNSNPLHRMNMNIRRIRRQLISISLQKEYSNTVLLDTCSLTYYVCVCASHILI